MYKKFFAEFIGTFGLAFGVYLASQIGLPLGIPVLAALIVGIFVYTVGSISGAHLNPAVTLGAWSIGKISTRDAVGYLVVQFIGAGCAMAIGAMLITAYPVAHVAFGWFDRGIFVGEVLGTAILTFGIASVVFGKTPAPASGLVIGGSLLVGISMAAMIGPGAGFLNPAVALALGSFNVMYILGPIVGSLVGFWTYRSIA